MKFTKSGSAGGGPSSSIGIMRFFDTSTGGPKLTPEFVLIACLVVVIALLSVHLFA